MSEKSAQTIVDGPLAKHVHEGLTEQVEGSTKPKAKVAAEKAVEFITNYLKDVQCEPAKTQQVAAAVHDVVLKHYTKNPVVYADDDDNDQEQISDNKGP